MHDLNLLTLVAIFAVALDGGALAALLSSRSSWEEKAIWTVIVLLLPIVGAVLYLANIGSNTFGNRGSF